MKIIKQQFDTTREQIEHEETIIRQSVNQLINQLTIDEIKKLFNYKLDKRNFKTRRHSIEIKFYNL